VTRVADYIARYLKSLGVEHVFAVTGGGSIYLTDGMHCNGINLVSCHHEQAAAMAAEGYARAGARIGVCCVTTGCGGTNAITGVLGAWQDSVPLLVLSGQDPVMQTIPSTGLPLRQFGVQEAAVVPMVRGITKYAAMVKEPERIAYELDFALALAQRARPGPVWLDIPLDVQSAEINIDTLKHYEDRYVAHELDLAQVDLALRMLTAAERPVVIVGQGVRLAGACGELREFVRRHPLPVYATWLGLDCYPGAQPIGRDCETANEAIRNADLVLAIGSRLSLVATSYKPREFAPKAKVIVVDIDATEHEKPGVPIDLFIHADAGDFLRMMTIGSDTAKVRRCW